MSYGDGYGGGYWGAFGASGYGDGIRVEIDWTKTGVWVDETDRVRSNHAAVTASYGRDQSTALAPTVSGSGSFTLDNATRRYSSRNTSSPLYGNLKPARPVRIQRDIAGGTYTLFVGHTDDNPINPDVDSKTVGISLVDSLADFRGQNLSTPLHRGIRTGQAIGYILDACGWPAALRDLDYGATIIPWWWEDGTDALTALEKVIRSEGPPAMLTMGTGGEITFRDRHHRLARAASTTSQQSWGGAVLPLNKPFSHDEAWTNIVNSGTADVDVRIPGEVQEVWTSDATISIAAAGQQKLVTASASDPFYDAVVPVAGVDWTVVSGTMTATLFRTSGASTTILLTAVDVGGAIISNLKLRARPVPVAYSVQESAQDVVSVDDYGTRSFPGDLPWCSADDAGAVLRTAVALRGRPLPIVSARFMVGKDPVKATVLVRDLSDRVHVIEAETVTDADFYIETIGHDLTGPHDHAVTFGLEASPTQVEPVLILGVSGRGLGQGYLGNPYIDTQNLFTLGSDVVGHKLGSGVLAA